MSRSAKRSVRPGPGCSATISSSAMRGAGLAQAGGAGGQRDGCSSGRRVRLRSRARARGAPPRSRRRRRRSSRARGGSRRRRPCARRRRPRPRAGPRAGDRACARTARWARVPARRARPAAWRAAGAPSSSASARRANGSRLKRPSVPVPRARDASSCDRWRSRSAFATASSSARDGCRRAAVVHSVTASRYSAAASAQRCSASAVAACA